MIMLDLRHIEWMLDFLSGSGPMGELLLQRKDGFVFSEAKAYPAQAIGCDFRWGLLCEDACSEAFSGRQKGWAFLYKFYCIYSTVEC